jgi:hypothetical protein
MTEDTKTGTIRSCTAKGTDVDLVLYENHANDSRVKEVEKCPTMNSRMGTGGGESSPCIKRPPERLGGYPD